MNTPKVRHGKIPKWYEKDSKHYDAFNENTENSRTTNHLIEKILKKNRVKSVLDLTCGTGSQVFWLAKRGYEVTGSDISPGMLKVAKSKEKKEKLGVKLLLGDMRTVRVGEFDAAISIFNAVGHLTKAGFEKSIRNVHRNLKKGGIYIFDIFNLDYLNHEKNISKLTIDWIRREGKTNLREVQHSIVDQNGVLVSYTTSYVQKNKAEAEITKSLATLQVYSAEDLREILARNAFKVVSQCGIDGSKYSKTATERILTIAKRGD